MEVQADKLALIIQFPEGSDCRSGQGFFNILRFSLSALSWAGVILLGTGLPVGPLTGSFLIPGFTLEFLLYFIPERGYCGGHPLLALSRLSYLIIKTPLSRIMACL